MKNDAIKCFLSINILIWGLTSLLYAQDKRPMTVDDALNIVRVGELQDDDPGYSQAAVNVT